MPTEQLLPPSEFPTKSRKSLEPAALKKWGELLQLPELENYRIVRDAIANTLVQKASPSQRQQVRKWTDDEFMEFALNSEYPDDIEEQIEKSWRR
jgi:hypothetical protein